MLSSLGKIGELIGVTTDSLLLFYSLFLVFPSWVSLNQTYKQTCKQLPYRVDYWSAMSQNFPVSNQFGQGMSDMSQYMVNNFNRGQPSGDQEASSSDDTSHAPVLSSEPSFSSGPPAPVPAPDVNWDRLREVGHDSKLTMDLRGN
jgi:hypothetical protein